MKTELPEEKSIEARATHLHSYRSNVTVARRRISPSKKPTKLASLSMHPLDFGRGEEVQEMEPARVLVVRNLPRVLCQL
jgi:hypothetical protein